MSNMYLRTAAAVAAVAASFLFAPALTLSASAREVVPYSGNASPGTIVVHTSERRLYLVLSEGRALRYTVGVGRAGRQWAGRAQINGKHVRPAWAPPPDLRKPGMPAYIPAGSPDNPMGAAALTLSGGDYAIHGTNNASSIGGFVSAGCIRMYNQDIVDLYERVGVGTPVIVTR